MKKINYHTHTELCRHAGGTEEEYVNAALSNHLDILGISEHAAFPDDRFGLRMLYDELNPYLQELNRLQTEYAGRLTLCKGLEIEYCPDMLSYYKDLLEGNNLDYLLLGQHFYSPIDQPPVNIYMLEETGDTSCYVDYALSLKEGMETGFFRVLAHPDVIFINNLPWDDNCDEACDIILKAARDTQTILEFNANGLRRGSKEYCDGMRCPYPHPKFWSKVSGSTLPVLVSSDCHSPDKLWDNYMDEAYRLCQQWRLHVIDDIVI